MYVKVLVNPGAKREIVIDRGEGRFDIAVREPALQNRANMRVREIIARCYQVPIGKVRIQSGHRSPGKIFLVDI